MSFAQNSTRTGRTIKRAFDILVALSALITLSPFLLFALVGIKIASPGPVFYKAKRVGRGGQLFHMIKFRTMHVGADAASAITAPGDKRVFGFGSLLRTIKIDELPQFWNVLKGDMSLVGPRPEDPKIVQRDYTAWMRETLRVRPGITGPGSVYGYIFGDTLLVESDPEGSYAEKLLPPKLALERAYIDRANPLGDLFYILLTCWAIVAHIFGSDVRLPSSDLVAARQWAPDGPYPTTFS